MKEIKKAIFSMKFLSGFLVPQIVLSLLHGNFLFAGVFTLMFGFSFSRAIREIES